MARLDQDRGFPPTLSSAELGGRNDPGATRDAARQTAETLTAAGIDLDLAPVVDLNLNPSNPVIGALDRSSAADPDLVVSLALRLNVGMKAPSRPMRSARRGGL